LALWDSGISTGMRGLASRLELRYCGTPSDRGYLEDVGQFAEVGILAGTDPSKQASDLMYGRYLDRNIEVFNYNLGSFPEEPSSSARSCVVVTFNASFPRVTIAPHTRMSKLRLGSNRKWLSFAPEEFRQRFNVEAPDDAAAQAILSDEMISWLMAGRGDVRLALEGGALIGHIALLSEDDPDWDVLVDFVVGFHGTIPAQAWVDYSIFGSPS
jgi:hypothetical protein